jgi:hypothetical protein
MRALVILLAGCGVAPSVDDATQPDSALGVPVLAATGAEKVLQLTGDFDRERNEPTLNRTGERAGLWNTDLGASFEHAGTTYLLFGDSIAVDPSRHAECDDAIATMDGLAIELIADGDYISPVVPGVALGCYEVPLDGISANGAMYVWFSTAGMTRSVLARSDDNGRTFALVHELSSEHAVNVSAVRDGDTLYLFASGSYRDSGVFLARAPIAAIEDRGAYEWFAGHDATDAPVPGADRWTADEHLAAPLFGPSCVGELSAHQLLDGWLVLYNCDEPRGIQARFARAPGASWSEQVTVFEPWRDNGYCHFMHAPDCDAVNDPGREAEWGGEYGPYLIERLTEPTEHGARIQFVMSTWNPYATVVMTSELSWR